MRTIRLAIALGVLLAAGAASAQEAGFKVVVNASNGVSSLKKDDVAQYFMKRKTSWPGGESVQPVDQAEDSRARVEFSKAVLKKDVAAMKSYWQTQIFSGRGVPPPEKVSDAAVLAYVEANAGAIGYVSAAAKTGRGAREVPVN